MPDDTAPELSLKITTDNSGALPPIDTTKAGIGGIITEMSQAQMVADKFGISLAEATKLLTEMASEDKAAKLRSIKDALREAAAEARNLAEAQGETNQSAEEGAESQEAMTKRIQESQQAMIANAFYLHRMAEGVKDIALGGRMAGQGMMDLEYGLQRVLPPMYQAPLAGAGMLLMLATLITRHREAAGEAKAHAEDEKTAADEMSNAWKTADDLITKSLDDLGKDKTFSGLLGQAKQFTSELHIQETALRTIQAALDRLEDAKFGAQEALLNRREQEELQGKTGEEADQIRLKYEKQLDQLRGTHEKEKAQRDLNEKQAELLDLQNQKKAVEAEVTAAAGDVQRANEASSSGTTRASLNKSDFEYARDTVEVLNEQKNAAAAGQADMATGELIKPLSPEQWVQLQTLSAALPQLHQAQQEKGPQYTEQIDRLKKERDDLQKEENANLQGASPEDSEQWTKFYAPKFADIEARLAAMTKTEDGRADFKKALDDSRKAYEEGTKTLADLNAKIEAAKTDLKAAGINIQTATDKSGAAIQKDVNAQQEENAKVARDNRDKELDAKIRALEAQLETTPDEKKAPVQAQIEGLNEEKARNKRDDALAGAGTDAKSATAIKAEYESEITDLKAKLEAAKQRETAREAQDSGKDTRELESAINAGTAQLKSSGHKELAAAVTRMGDAQAQATELMIDLANNTDAKSKAILDRLKAAEKAIHRLK